jgi:transcription termination factor Rho
VSQRELESIWKIRRLFSNKNTGDLTEAMIKWLLKTRSNAEFIDNVDKVFENR